MTVYVVNRGHVGVEPWVMTPGQVDAVQFTNNVGRVRVTSNGLGEVRATVDGTDPVFPAAGASTNSYRLPADLIDTYDLVLPMTPGGGSTLKLKSIGLAKVSVQVIV